MKKKIFKVVVLVQQDNFIELLAAQKLFRSLELLNDSAISFDVHIWQVVATKEILMNKVVAIAERGYDQVVVMDQHLAVLLKGAYESVGELPTIYLGLYGADLLGLVSSELHTVVAFSEPTDHELMERLYTLKDSCERRLYERIAVLYCPQARGGRIQESVVRMAEEAARLTMKVDFLPIEDPDVTMSIVQNLITEHLSLDDGVVDCLVFLEGCPTLRHSKEISALCWDHDIAHVSGLGEFGIDLAAPYALGTNPAMLVQQAAEVIQDYAMTGVPLGTVPLREVAHYREMVINRPMAQQMGMTKERVKELGIRVGFALLRRWVKRP